MVHKLTIAVLFLLGACCGVGVAWPRPTRVPAFKYIADGDSGYVHLNGRCKFNPVLTFVTKEEAEALQLKPCPVCIGKELKTLASTK